jgi:Fe-S-cluster-containing dehydrogenase component
MRCNGCVIACKRTWKMKADDPGVHKVAPDSRVMIKSQQKVDVGPFVRYSCWHCPDPPCARRCPFKAITKEADGAVSVDHTKCDPTSPLCSKQCLTDCQRGGYPKIGVGTDFPIEGKAATAPVMQKCTMCHDRYNAATGKEDWVNGVKRIDLLPSRDPNQAHQPTCVMTCPAKAMSYETRDNIVAEITALKTAAVAAGKVPVIYGDGSMFWFSSYRIVTPKADPFVEDHVAPLMSSMLSSPFARAALVPTLVVGGIAALAARKAAIAAPTNSEV